jgi:hypothetical protein
MKFPQLLLILLTTLFSCRNSAEDRARAAMEHSLDSIEAAMQGQAMRDSIDMARAQFLDYQIDSITKADYNFNSTATMYWLHVHKTWDTDLDRNTHALMAVLKEEIGTIAIVSTLQGKHRPVHDKVEIEVAGKKFLVDSTSSYPMTRYNKEHGYTHLPDAIGEVLWIEEDISLRIMQAIAASPNAEVEVYAYAGDHLEMYYTLNEEDKKAMIASYKFLLLVKERNALEGGNPEWDD